MLIDCAHYRAGSRQHEDPMSIAEAGVLAAERDGFVWLGIHEPTEQEMGEVATHFPVHELAIEDSLSPHQRPKAEQYEGYYFLVCYFIESNASTSARIASGAFTGSRNCASVAERPSERGDSDCKRAHRREEPRFPGLRVCCSRRAWRLRHRGRYSEQHQQRRQSEQF